MVAFRCCNYVAMEGCSYVVAPQIARNIMLIIHAHRSVFVGSHAFSTLSVELIFTNVRFL